MAAILVGIPCLRVGVVAISAGIRDDVILKGSGSGGKAGNLLRRVYLALIVVHVEEDTSLTTTQQLIRVGHSPDPDDAIMFHALANGHVETGEYRFEHELVDIEMLNQRAFSGELELTAISVHAYAHLADKYILCSCGASMGDQYGPMVVTREPCEVTDLVSKTIAVPGTLTSAYLALRLCLQADFDFVVVPFDEIIASTVRGSYNNQRVDAGLIIHEGQLTYGDQDLQLVVDLGKWWYEETSLPLPLGANALRRDLGTSVHETVERLLKQSIQYALDHRQEALEYALQFGRDLDRNKADQFVGMYVNDWTLDFGERGKQAVNELLRRGYQSGVIRDLVEAEFV